MGAAWAKVLAYLVSAILLYIVSQRVYPMTYEWSKVLSIVGLTSVLYTVATMVNVGDTGTVIVRLMIIVVYLLVVFSLLKGGLAAVKGVFRR
jgi:hypothetical protein